ncbi:methylenetetrahydrofolate reductase [Halobellus clavatus]|jgi:methylenetetrahydrofolate reductase (NADPH)|uniref:Methylenetetrahydrofolate reductase (NADPH) n=1 Tax=Halobellus clavatus TaxID=660517 RepID=A0A1H3FVH2_9EURY|nr:methylenetetrahydrofolate reductase [Halobellus clavatus]SDX94996.1 methylenetetrahydrofolate reductase (NADPH) [Halobellus clavatus]
MASQGLSASTTQTTTESLLENPRFELMPFDSFDEEIAHLPEGATVTITASPQLELEATIEAAEEAAQAGYEVVPHVSARYVRGPEHLAEICERLKAVGIDDIFVPGGDREEPIGEFESAYDMLVALDDLEYEFEEIGITGYPEGHEFLSQETLTEAMEKKAPYATYIATQLCYDPETILEWIETIRDRGIDLPVEVGIPGVMKYEKLLNISQKVGVGDSVRFLKKTTGIVGFVKQFIGSRGRYRPDELVDGLGPHADEYGIRGIHVYTFNQVPDTEEWRTSRLQ